MSKQGKEYLKGWVPFRIMRYYGFALITLFSLVIPWIKINEHHFFLLSFQNFKLDLMFVQFDMQEMYLMPFLLILMFVGVFGITVVGGRVFCGWMCPQTIFRIVYRDFIETTLLGLRKRIKNKQKEPDYSKIENQVKRVIAVLLWTALAAIAAADLLWFFVPPEDFLTQILNPNEHPILMGTFLTIVAFLVADIVFIKENFCIYVCPYSRIQSVLYDDDTIMAIYNPHRGGEIYDDDKNKLYTKEKELRAVETTSECTTCESCVTVCPTHIDIRQGLQLECINCLECVDACTTVMGNLGKESLVTWSSDKEIIHQKGKTNFFRSKVLGTGIMMLLTMVLLGYMGSKKEQMLLNVNKENRLYSVKHLSDGKIQVDNAFIFLLQNTLNDDHKYFFEVIQPEGLNGKIFIAKPTEAFTAQPSVKKKKIVILRTTDILVDDSRKNTIIPITIKAYAIDDPENIVVFRKSTFTFPRADKLKK